MNVHFEGEWRKRWAVAIVEDTGVFEWMAAGAVHVHLLAVRTASGGPGVSPPWSIKDLGILESRWCVCFGKHCLICLVYIHQLFSTTKTNLRLLIHTCEPGEPGKFAWCGHTHQDWKFSGPWLRLRSLVTVWWGKAAPYDSPQILTFLENPVDIFSNTVIGTCHRDLPPAFVFADLSGAIGHISCAFTKGRVDCFHSWRTWQRVWQTWLTLTMATMAL